MINILPFVLRIQPRSATKGAVTSGGALKPRAVVLGYSLNRSPSRSVGRPLSRLVGGFLSGPLSGRGNHGLSDYLSD